MLIPHSLDDLGHLQVQSEILQVLPPVVNLTTRPLKPRADKSQTNNLQTLSKAAGELKKDVVDPLRSSLNLSAVESKSLKDVSLQTRGQIESAAGKNLSPALKGWTQGLGVTGGALGGVAGLSDMVGGLRDGDAPKTLAGAADVAVSASALATLGMIGGAAVLGPASTVLLGMRGLQRAQKDDRATNLAATSDLLTAGMFCAKMLPITAAIPIGLGIVATAVGLFRGLNSLKKGVEAQDPGLRAKGTGETLTALGVTLVASGVAIAPGIALMLGGAALPLLQRLKTTKSLIAPVVDKAAQALYPMSVHSEAVLDKVSPHLKPVKNALARGKQLVEPVTRPLSKAGDMAFQVAQKGARWVMNSWVVRATEEGVGHLNKVLLPTDDAAEQPAS